MPWIVIRIKVIRIRIGLDIQVWTRLLWHLTIFLIMISVKEECVGSNILSKSGWHQRGCDLLKLNISCITSLEKCTIFHLKFFLDLNIDFIWGIKALRSKINFGHYQFTLKNFWLRLKYCVVQWTVLECFHDCTNSQTHSNQEAVYIQIKQSPKSWQKGSLSLLHYVLLFLFSYFKTLHKFASYYIDIVSLHRNFGTVPCYI